MLATVYPRAKRQPPQSPGPGLAKRVAPFEPQRVGRRKSAPERWPTGYKPRGYPGEPGTARAIHSRRRAHHTPNPLERLEELVADPRGSQRQLCRETCSEPEPKRVAAPVPGSPWLLRKQRRR